VLNFTISMHQSMTYCTQCLVYHAINCAEGQIYTENCYLGQTIINVIIFRTILIANKRHCRKIHCNGT